MEADVEELGTLEVESCVAQNGEAEMLGMGGVLPCPRKVPQV